MIHLVLLSGLINLAFTALPSGWMACSKSSPNHNECLKNQIQTAIKALANGVPELNIGRLEPFPVKDLALTVNSGFNLTMDNGVIEGFTNIKVINVESKPWSSLKIKSIGERVKYYVNYTAAGNLFNLKIRSSGEGILILDRVTRDINMTFTEFQKGGKTYLKVKEMSVSEIPENTLADFRPNGRGYDYRTMINKIINDNWRVLLEEQQSSGFEYSKRFFTGLINSILAKIPKEDLDLS